MLHIKRTLNKKPEKTFMIYITNDKKGNKIYIKIMTTKNGYKYLSVVININNILYILKDKTHWYNNKYQCYIEQHNSSMISIHIFKLSDINCKESIGKYVGNIKNGKLHLTHILTDY